MNITYASVSEKYLRQILADIVGKSLDELPELRFGISKRIKESKPRKNRHQCSAKCEKLKELYIANVSLLTIANALGITRQRISQFARNHNWPRRRYRKSQQLDLKYKQP